MRTTTPVVRRNLIALLSLSLSSTLFAGVPAYKFDKAFGQNEIKAAPTSLAINTKDCLHVLLKDGTVMMYDTEGKLTGSFKSDMKPAPSTMAVTGDRIYLLASEMAQTTREFQGKKVKVNEPSGVKCCVYDPAGAKQAEIKLAGVVSATAAHFVGDKLVVADFSQQSIVFFSVAGNEGKMTRKISKVFRLCCGIFDFCAGQDADSIVVANLGAFKVQTFQADKKFSEFGARGEKESEFQGCCNPVNVACLADGSIVTVEKAPTRVKIYDKTGKTEQAVTGIANLVEGCSQIPTAIDSKGALYLASDPKKCIVKCVAGAAAEPTAP